MLEWINHIELKFLLNDQKYQTTIIQNKSFKVKENGQEIFESDEPKEFESFIDTLFKENLNIDPIKVWTSYGDTKHLISHNWIALSSSIFIIDSTHKNLFGEVSTGGLPGRILLMFLGVPWARTKIKAKALKDKLKDELAPVQDNELLSLTKQKNETEESLANQEYDINEIRSAFSEAQKLLSELANDTHALNNLLAQKRDLENELNKLKRKHNNSNEKTAIEIIMSGVKTKYCPRCAQEISEERLRKETETCKCALCSQEVTIVTNKPEQHNKTQRDETSNLEDLLITLEEKINLKNQSTNNLKTKLEKHQEILSKSNIEDIFKNESRALFLNDKIDIISKQKQESSNKQKQEELEILTALEKLMEKKYKNSSSLIFEDLGKRIKLHAENLGMDSLEKVKISGNAHLTTTKHGTDTRFTQHTEGERLRLKIATTLAMLEYGYENNIGSHPGLLIIDKLTTEELAHDDAEVLVKSLVKAAQTIDNLQIVFASAMGGLDFESIMPNDTICKPNEDTGRYW